MSARQSQEPSLVPELEAIAQIADQRLRAEVEQLGNEPEVAEASDAAAELRHALVEAAGAALAVGVPLGAVADAERIGRARARRELSSELLRRVDRAARRHREAQAEHELTIARADRLGLSPPRDLRGRARRSRHGARDRCAQQRASSSHRR